MTIRYTWGGDEHLFVEVNEEMSLNAFFQSLSITSKIKESKINGVNEICPANASFQVKFNPDIIDPDSLKEKVVDIIESSAHGEAKISTRIIEVPVLYNDPWTHETLMRFRERHQDPDSTDLEYAARINGYDSVEAFIEAHSKIPWMVTMVGFVAGLPFMYQMLEKAKQIQVPKYLRPRTDTPKLTLGYGGCFSCIYSVRGAGGYQMFGVTPMPIYDPEQKVNHLKDFMVFFKPGDIVKFKPIERAEYDEIVASVDNGSYEPIIKQVEFDLQVYHQDRKAYNQKLEEVLYVD